MKNHLWYPIIIDDNGQQGSNSFLGLRDRYRCLCLLKNRFGQSDRLIPVNFFGELGIFRELPDGNSITDYTPFMSLNQSKTIDKKDEVQQEPKKELTFSF